MIPAQSAGGHPLPVLHPDDGSHPILPRDRELPETFLSLGEDLVLFIREERLDYTASRTSWSTRFVVGVCDADANHLAILAITSKRPPSETVLAAAIATARAAFPNHVRIAAEPRANEYGR